MSENAELCQSVSASDPTVTVVTAVPDLHRTSLSSDDCIKIIAYFKQFVKNRRNKNIKL
ncbi:MAG: hypothetical protein IJ642_09520 [Oscillospiraceae bacterium]|nr:hypothetical protein [Oscillospiraceae bacterium]